MKYIKIKTELFPFSEKGYYAGSDNAVIGCIHMFTGEGNNEKILTKTLFITNTGGEDQFQNSFVDYDNVMNESNFKPGDLIMDLRDSVNAGITYNILKVVSNIFIDDGKRQVTELTLEHPNGGKEVLTNLWKEGDREVGFEVSEENLIEWIY